MVPTLIVVVMMRVLMALVCRSPIVMMWLVPRIASNMQRPMRAMWRMLAIAAWLVDMAVCRSGSMQAHATNAQMNGRKINMNLCASRGMSLAGQAECQSTGGECDSS